MVGNILGGWLFDSVLTIWCSSLRNSTSNEAAIAEHSVMAFPMIETLVGDFHAQIFSLHQRIYHAI